MTTRVFHAEGPGDVIQAHKHWIANTDDPSQMSITFSSQFEECCRDIGAAAYIVSYHQERKFFRDSALTLEHRPKPMPGATGIRYQISEILYGLSMLWSAIRFRAEIAVLNSGSTHYFVMTLFRLAGIRVVTILHNTLWPAGFPPVRLVPRIILQLDSWFFRWASTAIIGVSPECLRQVQQLTRGRHGILREFRPQYRREYFLDIPPLSIQELPFHIMYVGRIVREKGVFDILDIARKVDAQAPRRVHWEVCGSGPDLDELRQRHRTMDLDAIVSIRGWTSPQSQREIFCRSHVSIIPTRSSFAEGLAMTAVEAVLAGRPVITNRVVPALEVLRPACVEARTDDVDSYVEAIMKLLDDPNYYRTLCDACPYLQKQFYDRQQGLAAVLRDALIPQSPLAR